MQERERGALGRTGEAVASCQSRQRHLSAESGAAAGASESGAAAGASRGFERLRDALRGFERFREASRGSHHLERVYPTARQPLTEQRRQTDRQRVRPSARAGEGGDGDAHTIVHTSDTADK